MLNFSTSPILPIVMISHLKMGGEPRFEEKSEIMEHPMIVPYMVLQKECQRQHGGKSIVVQTIQTFITLTSLFLGGIAHPLK